MKGSSLEMGFLGLSRLFRTDMTGPEHDAWQIVWSALIDASRSTSSVAERPDRTVSGRVTGGSSARPERTRLEAASRFAEAGSDWRRAERELGRLRFLQARGLIADASRIAAAETAYKSAVLTALQALDDFEVAAGRAAPRGGGSPEGIARDPEAS